MIEYKYFNDEYQFYFDGELLFSSPSVAVLFDKETGTLHKHGHPDVVSKVYDEWREKLKATDLGVHLLKDLTYLESGLFDCEELNKCINISGYSKRFYQKLLQTW